MKEREDLDEDSSEASDVRENLQDFKKMKKRKHGRSKERKWKRKDNLSGSEDVQSKRLDTTKLPWEIDELTSPSQLAPTLRETQALLRLFAKDRRAVKTSILMAARHPELSDSEWDNIIRG